MKEAKQKEMRFKKSELVKSERYEGKQDLLAALLEKDKSYALSETDQIIKQFMKGEVN